MPACPPGALSVTVLLFSVLLASTGCKKDHGHSRLAKGNLQNESGACLPGTVHGTWYNGVTLDPDTNYVEVSVEVTRTGYYRIGTDLQNGVMLADSGDFISTGLRVVRLKPIGTFISPMVNNFTVSFDSMTCGFTIHVQDSGRGSSIPLNTWRFTAGSHTYSGPATGALYFIPQSTSSTFTVSGTTAAGAPDSSLTLEAMMPETEVQTGTYRTSTSPNTFGFGSIAGPIFYANVQTPDKVIDIVITNARNDVTSRTVSGTFSGTASDAAGKPAAITNGAFNVRF